MFNNLFFGYFIGSFVTIFAIFSIAFTFFLEEPNYLTGAIFGSLFAAVANTSITMYIYDIVLDNSTLNGKPDDYLLRGTPLRGAICGLLDTLVVVFVPAGIFNLSIYAFRMTGSDYLGFIIALVGAPVILFGRPSILWMQRWARAYSRTVSG